MRGYLLFCSLGEGRTSFSTGLISRKLSGFLCFQLALFHSVFISFSSIDHLLHLYAQFLILFHLTLIRFSRSTHLLMCLSFDTLTFIIRTG